MKRKLFLGAMAAVVAMFGASSCTKEASMNEGGIGELSGFSLQIQTPKAAYVTRTIGNDSEFQIDRLDIYAFDGNNLVGTDFLEEGVDYTRTISGNVSVINFSKEWVSKVAGKDITFYAVANETSDDFIKATTLHSLEWDERGSATRDYGDELPPPTTKSEFEAATTRIIPLGSNDKIHINYGHEVPLLMSGQSQTVKLIGEATAEITLKRRVARFDIVNPMAADGEGQIVINDIEIYNMPREANVFASGPAFTPRRADMGVGWLYPGIPGDFPIYWNKNITYIYSNGAYELETDAQGKETWRVPSAFYMWPTILSPEAGADKMSIYIETEQNGKTQYYKPANEVEIKANYRYTFVLNPTTMTFSIETADFDDGGEINAKVGIETRDMEFVLEDFASLYDNKFTGYDGDYCINWAGIDPDAYLAEFSVSTEFGSEIIIEPLYGLPLPAWANTSMFTKETTVVGSDNPFNPGRETLDTYYLNFPNANTVGEYNPFVVRFKQAYGDDMHSLYFVNYDETDMSILFSDGMTNSIDYEINQMAGGGNYVYWPLFLDKITNITCGDTAEPIRMSDFENLKYLPNLQSLGIQYIDDAVTSINLVNNPKLFSVFLGEGANVASIKIASSSTRISSDIGIYNMPKLTSFDVSEFPGLEYISQLDLCPLLKTLDLRNNHNICAVEFYEPSGVETILFEGEYVNEFALNDMGNIKLTSLDLSKAKIKFRMPLLESMEHYGTTHNENPSGHNLSSFIFPATKGDVVMSKLYLINTKLRKLDVTNVVSSQGELIVVQNPLLLHLAIDPRGSSFTYAEICENNMGNGITIYLPDEVYDMLQSTGDLNVQGIYDVYKFLIADLSDSDVTWARYSTYAAATAGID